MPFGIWSLLPGRAQCKWTFSFQVSKVLLPAQGSLFNISQHRGRRLLRVPWTTRRSNQFILKEISPEYSLEGLMWSWSSFGLWPHDAKSWLIGKAPDAGKDWRQEEKGMTEHKMVGWYHWLNGHEFEKVLGDGEGQGTFACCSPWGHKESDTTERLNNNSNIYNLHKMQHVLPKV